MASAPALSGLRALGEDLYEHLPARRMVSSDREHVVFMDIRKQHRRYAGAWAVSFFLFVLWDCGGARPGPFQPSLARSDGRRERCDRRCSRGVSAALPQCECTLLCL